MRAAILAKVQRRRIGGKKRSFVMPELMYPLRLGITGTDTGVGKTQVTTTLCRGLRSMGRRVWLHKPMACGGWDGTTAEDARALEPLRGADQPAATLCPWQFPEPASPHLAAAATGVELTKQQLLDGITACCGPHDLLVEGAGGLAVPLTSARDTVADIFSAAQLPLIIVTRPHLGTLNHTALTAAYARQHGLYVIGLILNFHDDVRDSLATRTAVQELPLVTGLPVLMTLPFDAGTLSNELAQELAVRVLSATVVQRAHGYA
jgi:dethiobiotin synthetase